MRSWNVRSLSLVCSLLSLFLASQTAAQELPDVGVCAPEVTENRRATVLHDGAVGLWFHADVSRCLLDRLQALPLYVERVSLFEERLTLSDERQALTHEQVQLAQAAEERAVEALEAAERGRREAEDDRDAWYRHPALWFAVGVVVAGALVAVGIYGLSAIRASPI